MEIQTKFIVGFYNASDHEDYTWSEERGENQQYPTMFDTEAEAQAGIKEVIEDIADAVKAGNMDKESLETEDMYFIVKATLSTDGNITVINPDGTTYYDGPVTNFFD